jgi:hypothetical protein
MIDGKPQSVYAKTEAEVIAKLNSLRLRQVQGLDTSSSGSKWTIAAWLDHWYTNVVAPEAAPTTLDGYAISLNKHIKPFLGRVQLGKLTTERVERWQRELEAYGTAERRKPRGRRRRNGSSRASTPRGTARSTLLAQPRSTQVPLSSQAIQISDARSQGGASRASVNATPHRHATTQHEERYGDRTP